MSVLYTCECCGGSVETGTVEDPRNVAALDRGDPTYRCDECVNHHVTEHGTTCTDDEAETPVAEHLASWRYDVEQLFYGLTVHSEAFAAQIQVHSASAAEPEQLQHTLVVGADDWWSEGDRGFLCLTQADVRCLLHLLMAAEIRGQLDGDPAQSANSSPP